MSVERLLMLSMSAVMAVSVSCQSTADITSCTQLEVDSHNSAPQLQQIIEKQTSLQRSLNHHASDLKDTAERLRGIEEKQEQQILRDVKRQQLQQVENQSINQSQHTQRLDHLQQQEDFHFNQTAQRLQHHGELLEDVKHQQAIDRNTSSQHQTRMLQHLDQHTLDHQNTSLRLQQVEAQQVQQLMLLQQLQQQLANATDILLKKTYCQVESSSYFRVRFSRPPVVTEASHQLAAQLEDCCNPLLIQQNVDGSNFFDRTWNEFRAGFSGSNGNYWLGNELLHQLTKDGSYKLRFDLQSRDNSQWYWAEYRTFIVHNESTGYMLQIDGFTGNVQWDALNNALSVQNGMKFTTTDRDNDEWPGNCATHNGGGFWHNSCDWCFVNTMRGRPGDFSWWYLYDNKRLLQTSRMWLMCR